MFLYVLGKAGDWIATKAVVIRDIKEAGGLLKPNFIIRWAGALGERYLNKRGLIILYRGQREESPRILSPLARISGVEASQSALTQYLQEGNTLEDVASEMAKYGPLSIGHVGIPMTKIPGIAAQPHFGRRIIYILRVPISQAIKAIGWWSMVAEQEYMVLHEATPFIVGTLSPARVPKVEVDELTEELSLA